MRPLLPASITACPLLPRPSPPPPPPHPPPRSPPIGETWPKPRRNRPSCRPREAGNAVVIGMMIGAKITPRHTLVARPLNPPRAEHARRIAVDQKRQHHTGRILFAPTATHVEPGAAQIAQFHRFQNQMRQLVVRHPLS